jgi:putative PIN family toxin of toxin-antitoxin system
MKHWVVDTNVVVSALLTPGGLCAQILKAAHEGRIGLAYDPRILAEYRDVVQRRHLKISPARVREFLGSMQYHLLVVPMTLAVSGLDPSDLMFIEAALATPARTIVTGNLAHFPDNLLHGARVLTPTQAAGELALL